MQELIKRIKQEGIIRPKGRYLVALSGGCDSVALLFLLSALQKEWELTLYAAHINHGLRREAEKDEEFCRALCRRLNIPLAVFHEDIALTAQAEGMGTEEAGRLIRYKRLLEEAERCSCEAVVTAHQQEDQAETMLLHLLRGGGLPGLAGMRHKRQLSDKVELLRPLLSVSREELEAFLSQLGEEWREDKSNLDTSYRRNYIRHEILPRCEAAFPRAKEKIARTARYIQQAEDYMNAEAERFLSEQEEPGALDIIKLKNMPEALRFYIFRAFVKKNRILTDLAEAHYAGMEGLLGKKSGARFMLPGGEILLREQKHIRLLNQEKAEMPPELDLKRFSYRKDIEIPEKTYTKWLDYDIIHGDLCLRHRQKGDYFLLPDGRKKTIHRYMIDEKIPLSMRDKLWLLADGPHILWIVGFRLSYAARIREDTKTVLEVSLKIKE